MTKSFAPRPMANGRCLNGAGRHTPVGASPSDRRPSGADQAAKSWLRAYVKLRAPSRPLGCEPMLSEAQLAQYHQNGFVIPDYRLPMQVIADVRATHARFIDRYPEFVDYCPAVLGYE